MKKSQNKHQDHRTVLLEWKTPEFVPSERGRLWYLVAGGLMAFFVGYALVTGNLTMAVVFVLLAVLLLLTEKRKPRIVKMTITDMGIKYKGHFYPYHCINAFWLVYHPPHIQALYLRITDGRRYRHLRIELDGQRPQEVRELLLKEIPEIEGADELLADALVRFFKLQ